MAIEDILVSQVSQINLWIKGLGVFAAIWVIYAIGLFIVEKKKMNKLNEIEKKIDKLIKRK